MPFFGKIAPGARRRANCSVAFHSFPRRCPRGPGKGPKHPPQRRTPRKRGEEAFCRQGGPVPSGDADKGLSGPRGMNRQGRSRRKTEPSGNTGHPETETDIRYKKILKRNSFSDNNNYCYKIVPFLTCLPCPHGAAPSSVRTCDPGGETRGRGRGEEHHEEDISAFGRAVRGDADGHAVGGKRIHGSGEDASE